MDPVYALPAPLYPGHTIERQARRHPYAETLLAQLPPGWRGHFRAGAYEQGFEGCGGGLDLRRWDGPAGLPLSAWGLPAPMP